MVHAILVLVTVAFTTGKDVEAPVTLPAIVAALEHQENLVSNWSFRYTVMARQTEHTEEVMTKRRPDESPFKATEGWERSDHYVVQDGVRFRFERDRKAPGGSESSKAWVWDGMRGLSYYPDANSGRVANRPLVPLDTHSPRELLQIDDRPLFVVLREAIDPSISWEGETPTVRFATAENEEVRYELELSPAHNYVPKTFRTFHHDDLFIEYHDIALGSEEVEGGIVFVPLSYERETYLPTEITEDGRQTKWRHVAHAEVAVSEIMLNQNIPDTFFMIDFPLGTSVYDEIREKSFTVGRVEDQVLDAIESVTDTAALIEKAALLAREEDIRESTETGSPLSGAAPASPKHASKRSSWQVSVLGAIVALVVMAFLLLFLRDCLRWLGHIGANKNS
ncbi:MAG: hypothetical protein ACOX5J_01850 [Candidatus Hydrogenedentales bacterium]|jgi:hypothetical protein